MSRHARGLAGILLVSIFAAGRDSASNPVEDRDAWLKWNNETRMVYVFAYIWGNARGFRDGCRAGERAYSLGGKLRGLPGEKCTTTYASYSRKLVDYVDGITGYYGAYPADHYVPIFKVLEGLSDARKLTAPQMHEYFPATSKKPQ
jgi:hypothetical protein